MHAPDLDHEELLDLNPENGLIHFASQRALLIDAVAMGLLRKFLVESFGTNAARAVLTQFGFAQGWRMAEAMQAECRWDSVEDWRRAGPRVHALEGLFRAQPGAEDPLSKEGCTLVSSFEAEQHLLHFGRADAAVCWMISGLTSGYVSRTAGKNIYVLEERCIGEGASACHLLGRTREEWGEEWGEELHFFHTDHLEHYLDVSLRKVTEALRSAEKKLCAHHRALVRVARDVEEPMGIVAKSAVMSKVVDLARRVSQVDATVLLTGESGAGKERVARLIHEESMRASAPFIAVNCGAIPESLCESEFFGHTRGAFTGATQDRAGIFESANHGTLLLDEVGELPPAMQVKLLRTLQEGEVRRVGESKSRTIDVRVLAATNQDLTQEVAAGSFRQDLYYRLKVVEILVPPLRDRREDILPLARILLESAAIRMNRKMSGIAPPAADQLLRYNWPGNVRELENAMDRAVALARGEQRVDLDDLPEEVRTPGLQTVTPHDGVRPLQEIEKDYILAALERNEGNRSLTARQLGIGAATLYRRLKRYGLLAAGKSSRGGTFTGK